MHPGLLLVFFETDCWQLKIINTSEKRRKSRGFDKDNKKGGFLEWGGKAKCQSICVYLSFRNMLESGRGEKRGKENELKTGGVAMRRGRVGEEEHSIWKGRRGEWLFWDVSKSMGSTHLN